MPTFNAFRSATGSLIDRWLRGAQRHEEEFDCGVRVRSGTLAQEGPRWRYRRSAVDPLIVDGVLSLNHGTQATLRLRLDPDEVVGGPRPGHSVFGAAEIDSGARVQISVDAGELYRFGRG